MTRVRPARLPAFASRAAPGIVPAQGETVETFAFAVDPVNTDFLLTSPESDGLTWTPLPSPTMTEGGSLGYDPGHHLLYSSNGASGFWRVVTE